MNIHIFHDDKFTDGAIEQFERFYPNQNLYIVLLYNSTTLQFTSKHQNMMTFHIREKNIVSRIGELITTNNIKNIFVHYLDTFKASITLKVLSKNKLNFYWIFYGGDLYDYLSRYHGYDILDNKSLAKKTIKADIIKNIKYLLWFGWTTRSAMKRAFKRLDFFCFWNEYDYELFRSKIDSPAKYKNFIYYNALGNADFQSADKKNTIMINHSASPSGNHFHVFDLIKQLPLEEKNFNILLPLSYGDKTYADNIQYIAEQSFENHVIALRDFMPITAYQTILSEVKIAIFGMRRQEAAGNIFQLLNMGAKVFLREDNTLFHWLKKRNFIVFSLENDWKELEQLTGLSTEQIDHNKGCYTETFSTHVYKKMMEDLIKNI